MRKCLYNLSSKEVLESIPVMVYPFWGFEDLLDFPTLGRTDGALAVVDPVVVTKPPKNLSQISFNIPSKISVLIGNTAQESGLQPSRRFTGPSARNNFMKFLKKRLDKFSPKFFDLVLSKYKSISNENAQYMYETITTDVRCTCPSNMLAKEFGKSLKHSVYRYVVTHAPQNPVKIKSFKFPPKHAFHVWDAMALFGFSSKKITYKPSKSDIIFMRSIRETFRRFMKDGTLEHWNPGQSAVFGRDGKVHVLSADYHKKQCSFWNDEKNGFVPYVWIN